MLARFGLLAAVVTSLCACSAFVVGVDNVERVVGDFNVGSEHWRVVERFKKVNYFTWESDSFDYKEYKYLMVNDDGRSIDLSEAFFFLNSEGAYSKVEFSSPLYAHNDFHILACNDVIIAVNRRVYSDNYHHNSDCKIDDNNIYIGVFSRDNSRFLFDSYIQGDGGVDYICSAKRVSFCH